MTDIESCWTNGAHRSRISSIIPIISRTLRAKTNCSRKNNRAYFLPGFSVYVIGMKHFAAFRILLPERGRPITRSCTWYSKRPARKLRQDLEARAAGGASCPEHRAGRWLGCARSRDCVFPITTREDKAAPVFFAARTERPLTTNGPAHAALLRVDLLLDPPVHCALNRGWNTEKDLRPALACMELVCNFFLRT